MKAEEETKMEKQILEAIKNIMGEGFADQDTKIDGFVFRTRRPRVELEEHTIKDATEIITWDPDIEAVLVKGRCFYFRF